MFSNTFRTCISILFIFILQSSLNILIAQEIKVIVDTIYKRPILQSDQCLFINKEGNDFVFKGNNIENFSLDIDSYQMFYDLKRSENYYLFQKGERCYFTSTDLIIDTTKYIYEDLNRIKTNHQHVKLSGNHLAYIVDDSLFVSNINTHVTTFLKKNFFPGEINKNYIYLKGAYNDELLIYKFATKDFQKIPEKLKFASMTKNFIIDFVNNKYLHVMDLDLHDVISTDASYLDYYHIDDLLILQGQNKELKIYHKGKLQKYSEKFIRYQHAYNANFISLKTRKEKLVIIDNNGKLVSPIYFDKDIQNVGNSKHYVFRKDTVTQLYNTDFELIIEDNFDNITFLSDDRFIVDNGQYYFLINKKKEILNKISRYNSIENLRYINEFGTKLFGILNSQFASNEIYDQDGNLVISWKDEEGDTFYQSKKFTRGFNARMVESLTNLQEVTINPSGIWIKKTKDHKDRNCYYACDRYGKRLTHNFKSMRQLENSNQFLVRIYNKGKYGIIEINK